MRNLLYIVFACFLTACSHTPDKELEQALRLSASNRTALEAVLSHYKNDSLKLEAAHFLIRNMPYHYSKEEYAYPQTVKKSGQISHLLKEKWKSKNIVIH